MSIPQYQFGNNLVDLADLRTVRWNASETEKPRVMAMSENRTPLITVRPDYPVVSLVFREGKCDVERLKFAAVEALLVWWWFQAHKGKLERDVPKVVFTRGAAIDLAAKLPSLWSTVEFWAPTMLPKRVTVEDWVREMVWPRAFPRKKLAGTVRDFPGSENLTYRLMVGNAASNQLPSSGVLVPGRTYLVQPKVWLRDFQDSPDLKPRLPRRDRDHRPRMASTQPQMR